MYLINLESAVTSKGNDTLTSFGYKLTDQHTYAEDDELIVEDLIFEPTEAEEEGQLSRIQKIAEGEPLLNGFITAPEGSATLINAVL
ncbi:MAG: hypothetical protein F6K35_32930, partial [Okeania sp. SIO2H7]|nr:hypothetical protein [Okeania sp. SIO2H7]